MEIATLVSREFRFSIVVLGALKTLNLVERRDKKVNAKLII